jgi:hypothetical protein
MTREEFLAGTEFRIGRNFFKKEENTITKIYRSNDESRVIMEDYHMNIEKMGRVGFEAFTYVLNKRVSRKIRFEDLELFKS